MTHTHSVGLLWTRDRPVAEASSCTRHNIHTRQTSMPLTGFKTAIPASKRPQTHTFDRATTGIGNLWWNIQNIRNIWWRNPVIQFLRTYTSLVNSLAKSNNNPFQNFTALYHFRNTLHVGVCPESVNPVHTFTTFFCFSLCRTSVGKSPAMRH